MLSHRLLFRQQHGSEAITRSPDEACLRQATAIVVVCTAFGSSAIAQSTPETMVTDALRAASANILDTAVVSDLAGNILREGTSDYTCFPAPDGIAGPICMDTEWRRWMAAWMGGTPFTAERLAVAYMLAGDMPDGGASNIDPAAAPPTADNEWIVEGPHMMVITPAPSVFEGIPTVIQTDGPYVMWSGTPYVHLMVPIAARPDQRSIPTQ